MQKPKISLIIPVFNEESFLKDTLVSVFEQSYPVDEVIVVDNNSSDNSRKIALSFSKVKLVSEPKQGLIFAREKGFAVASGDILARIDANVQLHKNWTEQLIECFQDPLVYGVAGVGLNDVLPKISKFKSRLWSVIYLWHASQFFRVPIMWGANMAIRKTAWEKIRGSVCLDNALVHEDQDISCLMAENKLKVKLVYGLRVIAPEQEMHSWVKYREYSDRRAKTRELHAQKLRSIKRISLVETIIKRCLTAAPQAFFSTSSFLLFVLEGGKSRKRK